MRELLDQKARLPGIKARVDGRGLSSYTQKQSHIARLEHAALFCLHDSRKVLCAKGHALLLGHARTRVQQSIAATLVTARIRSPLP